MKVKTYLLFSDKMSTKMMQAFGAFEQFKVIIKPLVVIELDEKDRYTQENIKRMLEAKDDQPYDLVAVWEKDKVLYENPDVMVVSTGESWALLKDYIKGIQSHA